VPEPIENVAADRQSRRYAHTLRRGETSTPVRIPQPASSLDALDADFDIATLTKAKPTRPAEPTPPARPTPPPEPTNRASAPSESTALYRKRTNPSMPTISPEVLERTPPADDGGSHLPSVVLDSAGSGAVAHPLALHRAPIGLIAAIAIAALIVVALWLLH
jgi:hypothetical protein